MRAEIGKDMRLRPLLIYVILLFCLPVGCQGVDDPGPSPAGLSPTPAGLSPIPDSLSPTPAGVSPTPRGEAVRLRKTTIKTKQGQKWEMEADEVDWMDDRSEARAKEVTWWLIDENDKRWVKVESPRADVDMDREVVTFVGETVATRIGFPESLRVQKLVYKGKERKFYGFGGVLWKRADMELSGETLTATADLGKVLLKGRVKGKSKGGFEGLEELREAD